jgi:hypothetical protein
MKERKQEPQPDIFVEVNAYLEAKTLLDNEIPTIQAIAEACQIPEQQLNDWLKNDGEFKSMIGRLPKILDENLFEDPAFDNRADVMLISLVLLETKNKHSK